MIKLVKIKAKRLLKRTKYHPLKERLSNSCGKIQVKFKSKFHGWNKTDTLNIQKVKDIGFIFNKVDFGVLIHSHEKSKDFNTNPNKSICKISQNRNFIRVDWTRRRFSGEVESIIVKNGRVVEKIFVTKKGTRISVKRDELGIFARLPWLSF